MNTHKITLLFRRYFAENRRKNIQMLLIVFFVSAFFFFLSSQENSGFSSGTVIIFCFAALYVASNVFSTDISRKEGAMHYLLVPANSAEKWMANLIIVHIFANIALLVALFAGIYLGTFFGSLYFRHPINFHVVNVFCTNTFTCGNILNFFGFQSLLILGSVYFRKSAFVKTFLALGLFSLLLLLIGTAIFSIFHKETGYFYPAVDIDTWISNITYNHKCIGILADVVWILVCWALTFFRLKETEV